MTTAIKFATSFVLVGFLCSCATFEKNANSALGAMDIAVTVAKADWETYVANGHATPDQIAKANLAFTTYQKSKKIFADAMFSYNKAQTTENETPVLMALDALNYAALDIVDLVLLFVPELANQNALLPAREKIHAEYAKEHKRIGRK